MRLSRRSLLVGGGVAAAAVGVPAAQKLHWNGKNFAQEGYDPSLPVAPDGRVGWMNWSGAQKATPRELVLPVNENELAAFVRDSPHRVRPAGSGHSFTALAPTDGYILQTNYLSGLKAFDDQTGEATFGSGTLIFEACQALAERGRAFDNLPDVDVQTLAGAFSTATHGTGENLPALHDNITAFRIVSPNGDVLNVSREITPELFEAGKVSLGALGVITEYKLRTVPAFKLRRQAFVEKIDDLLDTIEERAARHRNFEFFYLPGTGLALSITHDETDKPVTEAAENDDDETMDALKQLRDQLGWAPWLRKRIAQANLPTGLIEDYIGWSHELLATTRPIRFNEMEFHLPRQEGPRTVKDVVRMLDRKGEAYWPVEYRHIASDSAWLSPFQGGPRASIAIHAAADERYGYFFKDFQPLYLARGGRPHWGKHHSLGHEDFASLYPDFEQFRALRRELDPNGKFLNPHLANIFGEQFDA